MDKFLIGFTDENSGYQSNLKPWLINDNAFQELTNMYVYRGRVRKRFGSIYMGSSQLDSRLRILIGVTDGSGNFSGTVPGDVFAIGQMFSVDSIIFTVYQTGTPGSMLSTTAATGTYDTSTGAVVLSSTGLLSTSVYFYPATPVMGLTGYLLGNTNEFTTMGFDTQFAYEYDLVTNAWKRQSAGESVWTGTDYQFFWSTNYQGVIDSSNLLWTTNFNEDDGIRYWDGSIWVKPVINYTRGSAIDTTDGSGNASGTVSGGSGFIGQVFIIGNTAFTVTVSNGALTPSSINITSAATGTGTFDTTTGNYTFTGAYANTTVYFTGDNYIATSLLIVAFRNRLLLFNTIESIDGVNTSFVNRLRYSRIGNPLSATAFMSDVPGNGGFINAPTQQAIKTAQFIKDRLIVYFQASTYELVYTGNQVLPFIWQKLNTELGAESTFSQVPFDKVVLGVGNVGIHACNGNNVDRIDSKIPSLVFSFHNENNGIERVAGIRDYYTEMVYWTYPSQIRNDSFYYPNKILTYNYVNNSWGINDDSFTCFGYSLLQNETPGSTWGNTTIPWGQNISLWNSTASSDVNIKFQAIIAGNQEGFVTVLRPDVTENASALQVTNVTLLGDGQLTLSIINHNLILNDFVKLNSMNGLTFEDSLSNTLTSVIGRVSVDAYADSTPNSVTITCLDNVNQPMTITGTYTGGGTLARVSNIGILTKQYNFYTSNDRSVYIPRVDFLVDKTDNGEVTVDYLVSSTNIPLVSQSVSGVLPGDGTLDTKPYNSSLAPLEQFQDRLWHPVYLYAQGQCVQLQIYMSPTQMFNYDITVDGMINFVALQDVQINAMVFYATPRGDGMQ